MPPSAVKTPRDLLYWQYAKIIADSAGMGKKNYGFVMNRFKKLQTGEIQWSTSIREYVKERETRDECIYCVTEGDLTLEHVLPSTRGGPDTTDNAVWVCQSCNSSKGDKGLYEWYGLDKRDDVPRIAEGKYLKLLHSMHEELGTLDEEEISKLCGDCILPEKCPEPEKLTVYCLEGVFNKTMNPTP